MLPRRGVLAAVWTFAAVNALVGVVPPPAGTSYPLQLAGTALAAAAVVLGSLAVRRDRMPSAWIAVALVGAVLPLVDLASSPGATAAGTGPWCTGGVIELTAVLVLAGRRLVAASLVGLLVLVELACGGVPAVFASGAAATSVALVLGVLLVRSLTEVDRVTAATALRERAALAVDARHAASASERDARLLDAGRRAGPLLARIASGVELAADDRAACVLLEQALRDEIRGRRLLNDAVRTAVDRARRRGATVQLFDEGGLDDLDPMRLEAVQDELGAQIDGLSANRIVIRSGTAGSGVAVTVVASTIDELAAALGLEDDTSVDVFSSIPRWPDADREPGGAIASRAALPLRAAVLDPA